MARDLCCWRGNGEVKSEQREGDGIRHRFRFRFRFRFLYSLRYSDILLFLFDFSRDFLLIPDAIPCPFDDFLFWLD